MLRLWKKHSENLLKGAINYQINLQIGASYAKHQPLTSESQGRFIH